jgi:hypothetical protein
VADLSRWDQCAIVYYDIINVDVGSSEWFQINEAFLNWSLANNGNHSNVHFVPGPAQLDAGGFITVQNGSLNGAAAGGTDRVAVGSVLLAASITLDPNFRFASGNLYFDPNSHADSFESAFKKVTQHEIGHTMGLEHYEGNQCATTPLLSVMDGGCGVNDFNGFQPPAPTECDSQSVSSEYPLIGSCPTPTPTPEPGYCNGAPDWSHFPSTGCASGFTSTSGTCARSQAFQNRCAEPTGYDPTTCSCPDGTNPSPIIVDVDHSGFSMTDAAGGVDFNILNDGVPVRISWTAASSSNAFLVLDRNGNGVIDSGAELFGDLTPQPSSPGPNGFLALAEFDKLQNGGNGDGIINKQDVIFANLRLWQDTNYNGISEASELHTLKGLGLKSIDVEYKESRRVDQYGNQFRYRSKVKDTHDAQLGRWAWDVFLKVQ